MGVISKILANEFTYATVQKRASQTGSKSRLALMYPLQNPTKRKKQKNQRFFWKENVFFEFVLLRGRKTASTDLFEKCKMTLSAWGLLLQNTCENKIPKQVSMKIAAPDLLFGSVASGLLLRVCCEPKSLRWCRIERVSRKSPNRDKYSSMHCKIHQQD